MYARAINLVYHSVSTLKYAWCYQLLLDDKSNILPLNLRRAVCQLNILNRRAETTEEKNHLSAARLLRSNVRLSLSISIPYFLCFIRHRLGLM